MAPRTTGELTGGMAHGGHIHHENYGFIGTNGPAPASTIGHSPDLHLGNLSSMVHNGHTPRTTLRGSILESTYPERLVPSLVASCVQVSHPRNQRTMAHDKLAQGMASTGHILLGNHVVNHTKGLASVSALARAWTSTLGI